MEVVEPGFYYHIYNHANGDEDIFKEERNYQYFLEKYKKYIHPIAETFAYCLMKNHFHFLVKIRETSEETSDVSKTSDVLSNKTISNSFKNLFQSYTKSINKTYNRKGSLFNQHFKRKKIKTDAQFLNALIYIHMNPVKHLFCNQPNEWRYSSYNAYIKSGDKTLINTKRGIELFENLENFIKCHTNSRADQYVDFD
jgi:REP element-mobilizing transposase RayT